MLLLYNDPTWYQKLSPEEMQKATEKYMAWMSRPFVKGGQRLQGVPGRFLYHRGARLSRGRQALARSSSSGLRRNDRSQTSLRDVRADAGAAVPASLFIWKHSLLPSKIRRA